MTDIIPRRLSEPWRGHIVNTRPWSDIANHYREFGGPALAPMLQLVETIAASPAAPLVFGATSMFDLLLSDCPDFHSCDSTLIIRYKSADGMFQFHHRCFSGHDDHKVCPEADALDTLGLFLAYKYGIVLAPPAPGRPS
jgi:hypothetical protein